MAKKIIKLTESDLTKIVKKAIAEQIINNDGNDYISELSHIKGLFQNNLLELISKVNDDETIDDEDKNDFLDDVSRLLDCVMGLY